MSLSKKVARNTAMQVAGKLISVAAALVALGFITRFLGKDGYGEYSTALAFLSFFGVAADMGLCTILARELSDAKHSAQWITSNIFTFRLAADIITFALVPIIALGFNYSSVVKQTIAIGSVAFLFISSAMVLEAVFQKELRVDKVAIAEVSGKTLFLALALLAIKYKFDFTGRIFMGAMAAGNGLLLLLMIIFTRKIIKFSLKINWAYWKHILKAAVPMSLAIIFNRIYFKVDTLMLSMSSINRRPVFNPAADVGIYNLPYKILEVIVFLSIIFVGIVFPILAKYIKTDLEKFKNAFKLSHDALLISAIPLVFGGCILAKPMIMLLGGSEFIASIAVFRILLFAVVIMFLNALVSHVIIAAGKEKDVAKIHFIGAILSVGTNLIFIPLYTYIGASATTIFVELIMLILGYWIVKKSIGYLPSFKIVIKSLFSATIMSAAVWGLMLLKPLVLQSGTISVLIFIFQLLFYIIIGSAIYSAVLYSIGGLDKEIMRKILSR